MYGFSTLVCLPDGMSHPGSVGTGTVMRPSVLEGYAREAGFSDVEILPIDAEAGAWGAVAIARSTESTGARPPRRVTGEEVVRHA